MRQMPNYVAFGPNDFNHVEPVRLTIDSEHNNTEAVL